MKNPCFTRTALASALATSFFCSAPQAATPVSSEFQVNQVTAGGQGNASIAADANGNFVVAWESGAQDGSLLGIYARRYDAAGQARGGEFRVNTFITNSQFNPSVAMDADGDFIVTWESYGQDSGGAGIYAQRYNAAGRAQGEEFRVNTSITGFQRTPSVATDANGDFVVAWNSSDGDSYGIYAQRYNAAGVALGGEFRINTSTFASQRFPSVAMDADGDFVAAWQSYGQDGSRYGIYAQRYNATGTPQGAEFRVNTFTSHSQIDPSVAIDADGDFVVAWDSRDQDGSSYGIYAQRYNAAGSPQGGEFRVNTFTTGNQNFPAVAVDAGGDFAVSWRSIGQDGSGNGIYGQIYNAAGEPQGGEFRVNTFTTNNQDFPSTAMDADGDFIVAWESNGQDGGGSGVFAQRYQGPEPVDLTLSQFDTQDPVAAGAPLSYSLNVANLHSPGSSTGIPAIDSAIGMASQVTLISKLPAGSSFNSSAGTDWICKPTGTNVSCRLDAGLPAGQTSSLTLNLTAPTVAGKIKNKAGVQAAQVDPQPTNNTDTEKTEVLP